MGRGRQQVPGENIQEGKISSDILQILPLLMSHLELDGQDLSLSCHYYGLKRLNFIGNGYFKTEFLFRRAKFNLIKSPFPVSEEHFRT